MNAMPGNFFNDIFGQMDPVAVGILIFFLIFYLLFLIFAIISYVLSSIGLYSIAKRRGIRHPWLAWIPVANSWIMGSISDHYQYVAKGKVRSRRKLLLGFNIASAGIPVVTFISDIVFTIISMYSSSAPMTEMPSWAFFILWLGMVAFMIVYAVFTYMALHDLYSSCNPDNAVVFLVLSIFISVTQSFFIFSCRRKDFGMPYRRQPQEAKREIPQPLHEEETVETDNCIADSVTFPENPKTE